MTQKEPESAGFKSDQHLAAATRHSPSPYFLPSPSLPFFAFFPTSASPVLVPTCCSLLLMEAAWWRVGHFRRGQAGAGMAMETELRLCCISWHWAAQEVQVHARSARSGELCGGSTCGTALCTGWERHCVAQESVLRGIVLYMVESIVGCSFVWRSCGKKHFEELQTGRLWGTRECDPKAHECDPHRKNVPYPWL